MQNDERLDIMKEIEAALKNMKKRQSNKRGRNRSKKLEALDEFGIKIMTENRHYLQYRKVNRSVSVNIHSHTQDPRNTRM